MRVNFLAASVRYNRVKSCLVFKSDLHISDSNCFIYSNCIMGIHDEGAGLVDVYCTMGVEVDARSRRLSASTSTP